VTELEQEKFDVGSWKAVHGREAQCRVLSYDRVPDLPEWVVSDQPKFKTKKKHVVELERSRLGTERRRAEACGEVWVCVCMEETGN